MKKVARRTVAVNILGVLAYMTMLVSWLLLLAVFFVMLVNSPFIVIDHSIMTSDPTPIPSGMTGLAQFASYGVTAVVIIVAVAVFVTLPYFMSRGMSRLLRRVLALLHVSATWWHMWLLKAVATVIPCVTFLAVTAFSEPRDETIPLFVVVFLASLLSIGLFSLQYFAAWRLKVVSNSIW